MRTKRKVVRGAPGKRMAARRKRDGRILRPVKKKTGRPTKLTADVQRVIEEAVEAGMSPSAAGRQAGLNPQTISEWRGRFPVFSESIEQARARGMRKRLDAIGAGVLPSGLLDWRAQAWLLERLFPDDFGKKAGEIHVSATAAAGSGLTLSEADLRTLQDRRALALEVMSR